jgi:hypothetical protein
MTPEEIKQAEEVIDSVLKGTGDLQPLKAVFPEPTDRFPVCNVEGCNEKHTADSPYCEWHNRRGKEEYEHRRQAGDSGKGEGR